jgi:hypothetical protein
VPAKHDDDGEEGEDTGAEVGDVLATAAGATATV